MDQSNINATGMEYAGRQHGDVSTVGSQLPMTLSKFQSNAIANKTLGSAMDTTNHEMITEKKLFEGQDHIGNQHQLLRVKPSLPTTATNSTSSGSSTASSSSVKKFFGRNKG